MDKFGRNYVLDIQEQTGSLLGTAASIASAITGSTLTISLPFTIEFDITRSVLTSANVCQIRIYNLSELKRNFIRHNEFDYGNYRSIRLKAGYGDNLATVFQGNISQAWSVREGNNFITQIECFDGGFAYNNGLSNLNIPRGSDLKLAIAALAKDLPHITVGAIGGYLGTLVRSNTYSGNTMQLLSDLTGGGAFIDSEKLNALRNNEFIAAGGPPPVISSKSGLLGTPVLEQSYLHFDMLFEPLLNVGRLIILNSSTGSNFNGEYSVKAVKHRGVISSAVAGTAITSGTFFKEKSPIPVVPAT